MKIVIADDHDIFRQSLSLLLSSKSEHQVVGDASSYDALALAVAQHKPDCILLDYHMPGCGALGIGAKLKRIQGALRIVMLTGTQSGLILKNLADSGVDGIVHKRDSADVIMDVITKVEEGVRAFSGTVQELIQSVEVDFTQREFDVLTMLVEGDSLAKIAERMNISVRTVEKHKQNMMQKADLTNVVQLIELGHRLMVQD